MVAPRKKEVVTAFFTQGRHHPNKGLKKKPASKIKHVKCDIILGICYTMIESAHIQDRRSAAALLTVRCSKKEAWEKLPDNIKKKFKEIILEGYFSEKDEGVRKTIAGVILTVAKRDFTQGKWPKLMEYIVTRINSDNSETVEIALDLFTTIFESISKRTLRPFFIDIFYAFQGVITDRSNTKVTFMILNTLRQMIQLTVAEEMDYFAPLLPSIFLSIKSLMAKMEEDKILVCLDFCYQVQQLDEDIVVLYIESIFDICVEIFTQKKYHHKLRKKSMYIFAVLVLYHKEEANKLFQRKATLEFVLDSLLNMIQDSATYEVKDKEVPPMYQQLQKGAVEAVQAMTLMNGIVKILVTRFVESLLMSDSTFNRQVTSAFVKILAGKSPIFMNSRYIHRLGNLKFLTEVEICKLCGPYRDYIVDTSQGN